jgi:ABC-type branched-subunit amino acid transport system substrate-binding protein
MSIVDTHGVGHGGEVRMENGGRLGRHRRGRGTMAVLLAGALLVSGCGARWSDEERASVLARHGAGSAAPAGVTTASSAAVDPGAAAPAGSRLSGGSAEPSASSGGAAAPGAVPPSTKPCAAASDAPGVTTDTLTVGQIVTKSGPVPGLAGSAEEAVAAYVAYRNATGGVCGRKVVVRTGDDGDEGARFRQLAAGLAGQVLGFTGMTAGGDGAALDLFGGEGIPATGAAQTVQFQRLPTVFDVNPSPPSPAIPIAKYQYLRDHGVRTAAVATLSAAAAISELDEQQRVMEASGIKIVSRQILPVSTLSFDSAARAVAASGADYLFFLGADTHDAAMARAMDGTGYELEFQEYLTGYGSNYLDIAGASAEGTTSWIRALPAEDGAGSHPELGAFLRWMSRVAPGARPDVFAADAWTASKAFFDSVESVPGPITRAGVVAQLTKLTQYDAGGFAGRFDLANERSDGCLIGMRVEGGRWRRMTPATGFLC